MRSRLALLFLWAGVGGPGAAAQGTPLLERPARLDVVGAPLAEALDALQLSSGVRLAYSSDLVPAGVRATCRCRRLTVGEALARLLRGTGLRAVERGRQVLIAPGSGPATRDGEPGSTSAEGVDAAAGPGGPGAPIPLAELVIAPGRIGVLDPSAPLSGATLTRQDIQAIPQFGDDPFRTLKRLPGVSSDDVSTRLHVRGGGPGDLLVRLDGLELDQPYHLKDLDGALGIVDVQALAGIDLVTGGFGPEFGEATAGVFDMRSGGARPGRRRTVLGASLSSVSAIGEGGFGDGRGRWLVSLRRGFLEYVLAVTDVGSDLEPSYGDALARVGWTASDRHAFGAEVLLAGDDVRWTDGPSSLESSWADGYGWLTWRWAPRTGASIETVASVGRRTRRRDGAIHAGRPSAFRPLTADVDDRADGAFGGVRVAATWPLAAGLLLKAGAEGSAAAAEYDYGSTAERLVVDGTGHLEVSHEAAAVTTAPEGRELGAWAALRGRTGERVTWEAGARWDAQSLTGEEQLSPRFLARWDPSERTSLKGSVGRYHQSHGVLELATADGEARFRPAERADQVAVGVEHRFGTGLAVRLEGYHRRVRDPFPEWVNLSRAVNPIPELESDRVRLAPDEARARGLELLVETGAGDGSWDAAASWALAASEQRIDGVWRPRTLDQRHTFNLLGALRLGSAWQLSGSWQYHTGWPFTDQDVRVVVDGDPLSGGVVRVADRRFGELNALRLPAYHRLDVRVTRAFELRASRLELYLDVFNAYDRTNLRGWDWDLVNRGPDGVFVAERAAGEEQLPILPTLGFRWIF